MSQTSPVSSMWVSLHHAWPGTQGHNEIFPATRAGVALDGLLSGMSVECHWEFGIEAFISWAGVWDAPNFGRFLGVIDLPGGQHHARPGDRFNLRLDSILDLRAVGEIRETRMSRPVVKDVFNFQGSGALEEVHSLVEHLRHFRRNLSRAEALALLEEAAQLIAELSAIVAHDPAAKPAVRAFRGRRP